VDAPLTGGVAKRCYTMVNHSKFARPDYVRVDLADASQDVLSSAYKSSGGGTAVIVAINKGSRRPQAQAAVETGQEHAGRYGPRSARER
jgi:O-glycosyl hydrolase